ERDGVRLVPGSQKPEGRGGRRRAITGQRRKASRQRSRRLWRQQAATCPREAARWSAGTRSASGDLGACQPQAAVLHCSGRTSLLFPGTSMLKAKKIRLEVRAQDAATLEFMQGKCRGLYNWLVMLPRAGERWHFAEVKARLVECRAYDPDLNAGYGKLLAE